MIADWFAWRVHGWWDAFGRLVLAVGAVTLIAFGVRWVLRPGGPRNR